MKISKTEASKVAKDMAVMAYDDVIKKAINTREKIVRKIIEKNIPAHVREFVEKNGAYFKKSGYIYISSPGYQTSINCSVTPRIPYDDLVVSYDDMEELNDAYNIVDDLTHKRYELTQQIKAQLLKLGTTKRVADQFPEAMPFFATNEKVKDEENEALNLVRNNFKSKLNDN